MGKSLYTPIHQRAIDEQDFYKKRISDKYLLQLLNIHHSITFNDKQSFIVIDHECKQTKNIIDILQVSELISFIQQSPDIYSTQFALY